MAKRLLIVGYGSAGQRHGRNLEALGCRIAAVDPRADRRSGGDLEAFETVERALDGRSYDGAVVASPTAFHVDQTAALLKAGIPTLLEKPVSKGLAEAEDLERIRANTGTPLLLGYTWRWWPPLADVRAALLGGEIGRIVRADFWMSAHLEDWHPGEPLHEFFMSSRELGGGALLDESHWIDLMTWLFGLPEAVYGRVERLSDLAIDSDDHVDILARYQEGPRVGVHLDLIGRPHEKRIRFVGTKGTLVWSADPNEYRIGRTAEQQWEVHGYEHERNDMFVAVARELLEVIDGAEPSCALADGVGVMRVIEAVRRSHAEGREIALRDV